MCFYEALVGGLLEVVESGGWVFLHFDTIEIAQANIVLAHRMPFIRRDCIEFDGFLHVHCACIAVVIHDAFQILCLYIFFLQCWLEQQLRGFEVA